MKYTLYTFGCSWTMGVGVGYTPKMSEKQFKEIAADIDICDKNSFRGNLATRLLIKNINYAVGGASNDRNFRCLSELLGDKTSRKKFLETNPIILFGITSTARIERKDKKIFLGHNSRSPSILCFLDDNYIPSLEDLKFLFKDKEFMYQALHLKLYYDHEKEVERLYHSMGVWNQIFQKFDIPILWYDTFNYHNYPGPIDNFFTGKDLLTEMLNFKKIHFNQDKKWYHFSDWTADDPRITAGVKCKLINPYSKHPTMEGHDIISKILYPYVLNLINKIN